MIPLAELVELSRLHGEGAAFGIASKPNGGRWPVAMTSPEPPALSRGRIWAHPSVACGDSPTLYNPKYLMAMLTARRPTWPLQMGAAPLPTLAEWPIPVIAFGTDEYVRRSMTLNSMRMGTEFFANGSTRVLQMADERLAAGQPDVVHDLLVYVMQGLLDLHIEERELRLLRAEAVAAYLGLDLPRVNRLFLARRLQSKTIAARIETGAAGPLRRKIDVRQLVESQLRHLRPDLQKVREKENLTLNLLDEVVRRLDSWADFKTG